MILTCPTCASRYHVDETKVGPRGRTVRCATCGEAWRAEPMAEPLQLTPARVAPSEVDERAPAVPAPDLASTPAEELPRVFRQKAEAKRRMREAMTAGVVWGAMAAGLTLLLLTAVVFRVQVVRLWPRTAGAYAAVRLTVNPLGVAPDNIQAAPGLENGRAALIVTGGERNIDSRSRGPVPLRISLYDKAGARLLSRVVDLPTTPLGGGESRPFRVSFLDPPITAVQVGVDFVSRTPELMSPPQPRRGVSSSAARPQLRGALAPLRGGRPSPGPGASALGGAALLPPVTARPIPVSSPFALPSAARGQTE